MQFPGNRSLRPASDVVQAARARLGERCGSSQAASAAAARSPSAAASATSARRLPAAGKLIQIQYLDGRRWRPAVKLGHTNEPRPLPDQLPLPPHQPPDADLLPHPRARGGRLAVRDGCVAGARRPRQTLTEACAVCAKSCAIPQTVVHRPLVSL